MNRSDLALAALASAAVPGMKPVAVARMGIDEAEAQLQQAVVEDATGRRWLVRAPLTAVAGARLQRNDELVRQLSRHLPFTVPAPAGYAAVGAEGSAAVYPHVEGMTLDLAHLPEGAGLAHAVGRAIAAIHNIPPAVFENQDVPTFDAAGCRQRLIADIDRAAETGRVPTRLLARWEEAFEAAPLWQFATTPVHGAFRGSTVLVAFADDDAGSGRVVAVTDWEEAMVADPATDLADLYSRATPGAWESVLDSYGLARSHRPDPYLHARARLISETRRLQGLARAVGEGEEDLARRIVESLRRMDRLTEDEDSLVPTTARGAAGVTAPTPAGTVTEQVRPVLTGDAPVDQPEDDGDGDGDAPDHDAPGTATDRMDGGDVPAVDPDATAEVMVPRPVAEDSEDVEDTDDRSTEVGSAGHDGAVPDEGMRDEDSLEGVAPGSVTEEDDTSEEMADEERLHELYGMPAEDPERTQPPRDRS
ncbi:phosphotransferase [Ornithinimicrobium sp. LYQ92]|uniref:phosphotransferase n=1 Tax=Serinicoccus sp. LYQ92 TaxID=3378798 RepID=UPI003851A9AC